ncbi:uncharacterized protein LOC131873952 [Cryptomeria japonica]|uniref:uncharacterized protein LOC131873952 n=1 Tax=Cryptomeria japonica TaxID=3369 RepID=UPI0027DA6457|nr:uncharacterized protein LOC131873952 [Cryptomeria japonica]
MHTSQSYNADESHRQDLFESDEEDEEEVEGEFDLEGEFLNALDELKNVRNEFKNYKKIVHEECSQLRNCLEESNEKEEVKIKEKEFHKLKEDMENLRKEYKMFKNASIVEQNWLVNSIQELEQAISNLKAQVNDARKMNEEPKLDVDDNRFRCKELKQEVETKSKMEKLTLEIEKCQEELKLRNKYNGGTEALGKMLSQ